MDWLVIIVIAVLALFVLGGYQKGFIKVAYGLVAIILSIAIVSVLTPYVKDAVIQRTNLYEKISEKCTAKVREKCVASDVTSKEEALNKANIKLPKALTITMDALVSEQEMAGSYYEQAGAALAMWIICGIAFVLTLILAGIIISMVEGLLDIVARLPLIRGLNQLFGALAGLLKGVLVLWLACIILTIFCTTDFVEMITLHIYRSPFLTFLYEHNGVLYLTAYFLA